jgi:FkbM family methyltransferase
MIRSIIEKWSRGVVLKRRLPAAFGRRPLFVSPEGGGLRYWKWSTDAIDPMLLNAADALVRPGHVVWDVGGNMGFFAFAAAARAAGGRVAVFEPDLSLCHLLQRSRDANPDLVVDIFPLAVSNRDGVAQFNIARRARSTNFLAETPGSTQTGGVRQTLSVPVVRLDTFLQHYPAPDVVKIDTETAEHLVIEGMQEVLRSARPVVLCEVSGNNFEFVAGQLRQFGYKLFDANELPAMKETSGPCDNILAIPEK